MDNYLHRNVLKKLENLVTDTVKNQRLVCQNKQSLVNKKEEVKPSQHLDGWPLNQTWYNLIC